MANNHELNQHVWAANLSMLTSASTLLCCTLPALLVAIGAGAALAGLVTAVPQLVWLSQHKVGVFGLAGAMLLLAGVMQWRARSLPCPIDPELAAACTKTRRVARWTYGISVFIFAIGVLFAFVLPAIY